MTRWHGQAQFVHFRSKLLRVFVDTAKTLQLFVAKFCDTLENSIPRQKIASAVELKRIIHCDSVPFVWILKSDFCFAVEQGCTHRVETDHQFFPDFHALLSIHAKPEFLICKF